MGRRESKNRADRTVKKAVLVEREAFSDWFDAFKPRNDSMDECDSDSRISEHEAIATFLNDGFSLEQATLLWRLLVQVEHEERAAPDGFEDGANRKRRGAYRDA